MREPSALEENDTTTKRVPLRARRVETQRLQKEALETIKEAKDLESVRCSTQKHDNKAHKIWKRVEKFRYCGTGHPTDSALHVAMHTEDVGRPTTSRQCAGQCRGSWTRDHHEVAGQLMI